MQYWKLFDFSIKQKWRRRKTNWRHSLTRSYIYVWYSTIIMMNKYESLIVFDVVNIGNECNGNNNAWMTSIYVSIGRRKEEEKEANSFFFLWNKYLTFDIVLPPPPRPPLFFSVAVESILKSVARENVVKAKVKRVLGEKRLVELIRKEE